jgi:hypothetical protein
MYDVEMIYQVFSKTLVLPHFQMTNQTFKFRYFSPRTFQFFTILFNNLRWGIEWTYVNRLRKETSI